MTFLLDTDICSAHMRRPGRLGRDSARIDACDAQLERLQEHSRLAGRRLAEFVGLVQAIQAVAETTGR